jgi:hypothetical protein
MNGKTAQSLTVKNKGNYKVVVTNEFGCSKTSDLEVVTVTNCRTGEPLSDELPLVAFPNPSTDYFQLGFSSESETVFVKIMDISGRVMEEREVVSGFEFGRNYPAGTYILTAEVNGTFLRKTLIKVE